jgi:NAD(P)-dependent dehydrogenase (short-subunit alcohol dehydrogenase family)
MSEPKIALVTGANKGIGYEIAHGLGRAGVTVLIGARDEPRGTAAVDKLVAEDITAVLVGLDVTDPVSVSNVAIRIEREYGRLDILVNNAGILVEAGQRPSRTPVETLRRTYETNVYGVITVTNAMLPLIRQARSGRIVNVSSGLGSMTLTSDPDSPWAQIPLLGYNSSKSALNSVTVSYANELRDTPIKVNAADPGYCKTDLNWNTGYLPPAEGAAVAIHLATLPDDGPTGAFIGADGAKPW